MFTEFVHSIIDQNGAAFTLGDHSQAKCGEGELLVPISKNELLLATCAGLFFATPEIAQAKNWGMAGGWEIFETDVSCAIAQEFEGEGDTKLVLALHVNGIGGMTIQNSNWSAQKGKEYDIDYWIGGRVYRGAPSIGINDIGVEPGFVVKFDQGFVDNFASGNSLTIKMGEVIVDQLSLKGSGAAIARARQCIKAVIAEQTKLEADRHRLEHIAKDPFPKRDN